MQLECGPIGAGTSTGPNQFRTLMGGPVMADEKLIHPEISGNLKRCTKCGVTKELDAFARCSRRKDGRVSRCRRCYSEARNPAISLARDRISALASEGLKPCTRCLQVKPFEQFNRSKVTPDGMCHKCRDCSKTANAEWRKKNPEGFKKWNLENRETRSASHKQWLRENRQRVSISFREWSKKNRHRVNANVARYKATKKSATPQWADLDAIRKFYELAARLTASTGEPHQVDHIVPLQSQIVCGLHWHGNLQILKKFDNISKLNRKWPGMPT